MTYLEIATTLATLSVLSLPVAGLLSRGVGRRAELSVLGTLLTGATCFAASLFFVL